METRENKRTMQTLAAMCAACCLLAFDASAQVLWIDGRMVDARLPDPPFAPNDPSECESYQRRAAAQSDAIHKAHEQCLASRGSSAGRDLTSQFYSNGKKVEMCSHPACQPLHNAMVQARRTTAENVDACQAQVRRRTAARAREPAPVVADPNVEKAVGEASEVLRRLTSDRVEVAALSAYQLEQIDRECRSLQTDAQRSVCLHRVHRMVAELRERATPHPVIRKIQGTSQGRIEEMQERVLDSLDAMNEDTDKSRGRAVRKP